MTNLLEKLNKMYPILDEIRDKEDRLRKDFRELGVANSLDSIPHLLECIEIKIIRSFYEFAKKNFEEVKVGCLKENYYDHGRNNLFIFDEGPYPNKISFSKNIDFGTSKKYLKLNRKANQYFDLTTISTITLIGIPLAYLFYKQQIKINKKLQNIKESQKDLLVSQKETILYLLENYLTTE